MKFLKSFVCLLCLTCLWSCNKEQPLIVEGTSLVGEWKVTEIEYVGTAITTQEGQSETNVFTAWATPTDLEGEFSNTENAYKLDGDFMLQVNIISANGIEENTVLWYDFVNEGSWERIDNHLIITNEQGGQQILEIIELTENSLKVKGDLVNIFAFPQTQAMVITAAEGTYTLTK